MTNQPGFKILLDKLKLMFLGAPNSSPRVMHQASAAASAVHPDLDLVVGNELLITDDIVEAYQGLSNVRGRVVIIDELPINKGRLIKASAFGIQVKVDLSEAQHMREAYLTREQS